MVGSAQSAAGSSKGYRLGTHRAVSPEETLARVRPMMPAFGITRVANLTGLDRTGVPVVTVCRPNARSSAVFHGKGLDLPSATASGVMEAIENWHAEHVQLPLRFGSLADLRRVVPLVEVARLPRAPGSRFDESLPLLWIEGRDIASGDPLWLPYETVHMNATVPAPPGSGCFECSTNGLASGNHYLEAVSHALCEVIERDATSLWHRLGSAQRDATRIDLATVRDAHCRVLLDRLDAAGLEVGVWQTTTDVGVPSFQCMLVDRTDEVEHTGQGAGCHPVPEIALLRALTEAVQVRTTYIVGSREDIGYADYSPATLQLRKQHARVLMRPGAAMQDFTAIPRAPFDHFGEEVAWIAGRLRAAGMGRAAVVDLTQPEYGLAVVRAVVPGLEGSDHHPGYVPGARARALQAVPA